MAFVAGPAALLNYKTEDALDDYGYVMMLNTSTGNAKKHDGSAVRPLGIALQSTESKFSPGTYESNVYVAIQYTGIALVKLSSSNSAITIGDYIGPVTGGVADKLTLDTTDASSLLDSLKKVIGIALESKAENAGGHIKVLLLLGGGV